MKYIFHIFVLLVCFPLFSSEVHWTKRYEGSDINSSLTFHVEDGDLALYNPLNTNFVSVVQLGYVRLGVQERVGISLPNSTEIIASVQITPFLYSGGSWIAQPNILEDLVLNFHPGNHSAEIDLSDYRLPGTYKFGIKLLGLKKDNILIPSAPDYIYLEAGIYSERYYALDALTVPSVDVYLVDYGTDGSILSSTLGSSTSSNTDELYVSWNYIDGAEYYDLEWSWVDNYSVSNLATSISAGSLAFNTQDFTSNSTRTRTSSNHYRIPNVFSRGYLIIRVRAVGRWLDAPTKDKYGVWSSGASAKTFVSHWPDVVTISQDHSNGKNWQYQATYAEEGKKKEVAQYFDGSLRSRQMVTRINSKDQSVVGETIYDNEGRGSISILPVPQSEPSLRYYSGVNKNTGLSSYSHKDFDWEDSTAVTCSGAGASPLSNTSGAGNYYSSVAHLSDEDWQQYVPESNGYALTQVEYTPDNTGRVRRQGGVGSDFQIGSGHQTDYYYLQPSQQELNRLFGYKVGYSSRYKKNMVVDGNGQVSVSYLDMQGRVIATAMSGDNTTDFESLKSESDPSYHQLIYTDFINKIQSTDTDTPQDNNHQYNTGRFGSNNDGLQVNTQLGVVSDGQLYNFFYRVESGYHQECQDSLIYPYVYDLHLSVKDDCGVEKLNQTYEHLIGTADIGNALEDFQNVLQTLTLDRGSYTVVKRLEINKSALEDYLIHYLNPDENPCLLDTTVFEVDVPMDCNTTCEECAEGLGTLATYLGQSMLLEGDLYDEIIATNRYNALYNACYEPCIPLTSCDVYQSMLKLDVSPNGQYAGLDPSDPVSVFATGKWRSTAFLTGSKNYLDNFGNIAYVQAYPIAGSSISGAPGALEHQYADNGAQPAMVKPWQLKRSDFIAYFNTSWSEALIEYHPEYPLYLYMTDICSRKEFGVRDENGDYFYYSSEEFDAILRNTLNGYENASQTNVYGIDFMGDQSSLLGPLFSLDPFFNQTYDVHTDVHATYLTEWKNKLMEEALTVQYKETGMTMFEFAALTVLCGNNPSSCSYSIPSSWTDLISMGLSIEQNDEIFQLYKSYYISYKGQINQLLMDMYGFSQSPGIFNGCIGPDGFTTGAIQSFTHSGMYPQMMSFNMVYLWNLQWFSSLNMYWFMNLPLYVPYDQTCLCSQYFNSKQIRITRIGALYNEGAPAETVIAEGSATTDYEQWQQTGLCPLAIDVERLLNKLAITGNLVGNTPSSQIAEMVPDLYEVITGGYPGPLMNIQGTVSSSTSLRLTFDYGQPSPEVCLELGGVNNFQGNLSWSDYGSSWNIYSVSQIYPIASDEFKILIHAGNTASVAQSYVVTVKSCIDVNTCQDQYALDNSDAIDCGKEKEFEQALLALLQNLSSTNSLNGSNVVLAGNPYYTGTILEDYLGAGALWNGGLGTISGGTVNGTLREFQLGTAFSGTPFITNLDLNRQTQTLYISFIILGSTPTTNSLENTYKYRINGVVTRMDFSCPCEEGQMEEISQQVENLFNELFSMDDPSGLQPQALLDMTWLFGGVEQEITGFFNTFNYHSDSCISYSTQWWPSGIVARSVPIVPCLTLNVCGKGIKRETTITSIYNLELNLSGNSFTATVMLSNGEVAQATGTLNCISIPPCNTCLPEPREPRDCLSDYSKYKAEQQYGLLNGFSEQEQNQYLLNDSTFCAGQFGYIFNAYLYYLSELSVTDVNSPLYLSITEFGFTQLGYSNDLLRTAVDAYRASSYNNYNNANFLPWNQYISSIYLPANPTICKAPLPPQHFPDTIIVFPCNQLENNVATVNAQNQLNIYLESKRNEFTRAYIEGALGSVVEQMGVTYQDKEYHYTLYYYDRAGNLIQTVPPKGVSRFEYAYSGTLPSVSETVGSNAKGETGSPNTSINDLRQNSPDLTVLQDPNNNAYSAAPSHNFNTVYRYNSLNQLVYQNTPDGGESRFAYDRLGRLIMSQNAKQLASNRFSYTRYDGLGRVVEAGEMGLTGYTIQEDGKLHDANGISLVVDHPSFPTNISTDRTEVTRSIYDELPSALLVTYAMGMSPVTVPVQNVFSNLYAQAYSTDNTRNRITGLLYFSVLSTNPIDIDKNDLYETGTFYDYDVHGNVQQLLQINKISVPQTYTNQHLKLMRYEYDLVSGNVQRVIYQPKKQDQFIHRYSYDDDNRITIVETSKDGFVWEKDAKYFYYDHGPLARTEIGEKKVQAMDYAYTLQGWIKSVNGEEVSEQTMMGADGKPLHLNSQLGRDAFGYSLSYYNGDYVATNTGMLNYSLSGTPNLDPGLYNGNIRSMHTALSDVNEQAIGTHQTNYTYDQLNRIKSMTGYDRSLSGHVLSDYSSAYSFDENGNLETLIRYAKLGGTSVKMDDFIYHYNPTTNQLNWVDDIAGVSLFNDTDVDNSMNVNNYEYDAIGQLTKDVDEEISSILWTVTNKVKEINYDDGKKIRFDYDAMGQRVAKHVTESGVTKTTYYVLDAQGNTMSLYNFDNTDQIVYLRERNIYGSSRIGQEQLNMEMTPFPYVYDGILLNEVGDKRYELSNHLGNVLQTVSDVKLPLAIGNVVIFNDQFPENGNNLGWHYDADLTGYPMPTGYSLTANAGELIMQTGDDLGSVYKEVFLVNGVNYILSYDITQMSGLVTTNFINDQGFIGPFSYQFTTGSYAKTVTGTGNYYKIVFTGAQATTVKLDNIRFIAENQYAYTADVKNYSDYYPYGMQMPGRYGSEDGYRYGFNGKEKDDEVSGNGNQYDYGFRIYNPRLGRFLSRDPLSSSYPWYTPYQFAGNKPIISIDLDGLEEFVVIKYTNNGQLLGLTFIQLTREQYLQAAKLEHAKLVNDVKEADAYNNAKMATASKKEKAEIQALNDQNRADVEKSQSNLTMLEQKVNENFSKVLIEEIDVSNGGVHYFGMETLKQARTKVLDNPGAYTQGKALSDELGLQEQNILNIGAPAVDVLQGTKFVESFQKGVGALYVNVPQVLNINFESNSAVLPSTASASLNNLYLAMVLIPDMRVSLVGHTDNVGSNDANLELSINRANSAKEYLVSKGIDSSRIDTSGLGASNPISSNDTESGKATNRRIEIIQN